MYKSNVQLKIALLNYFQILPKDSIYAQNWRHRLNNAMILHYITSARIQWNKCGITKSIEKINKENTQENVLYL